MGVRGWHDVEIDSAWQADLTAQVSACSGQGRACYVQALAVTQQAYQQAQQDVASACGSGGDVAACNTAKSDAAQLYVNQKTLAQSVATMTDYNTPLSNALHTAALDGLSLLGGAVVGKVVPALRSGWNSLSSSVANAFDGAAESTTIGDEPYAGANGTSDGGMAHPVRSNGAVPTMQPV
jgi:filamentous hemagglutinin